MGFESSSGGARRRPKPQQKVFVRLGADGARFTHLRDGLVLLGTVQQEAAIGALARAADGNYFQVNGDYQRKLNTFDVVTALRVAQGTLSHGAVSQSAPTAKAGPTVVVKRRRVVPQAAEPESSEQAQLS